MKIIKTGYNYILNAKNHRLIVWFLMSIGLAIRLLGISIFPAGLNQDEASIGYEAFSILTTGFDRNGFSYPVHLVSWGNGQNALYAYLSMPFIKLFGLNVFSVRIVNAIFSSLSLLIFYLIFKKIVDKNKALVALAILSICPWSIMSARWGLECNIFPPLFLLGIWLLLKGIYTSQRYFLLSFLIFAVSLYAYGPSYLILPVFFALLLPYLLFHKKISIKYCLLSSTLFIITALPIILFVIINHFDFPTIQFANITIPRLESNRTNQIFNLLGHDFLINLIKNAVHFFNVLFLQTDGNDYNAIPSFGTIYSISLPFFIIGLVKVLKNKVFLKEAHHYIFVSWLLCSFILGFTSSVNINRINIIFFPILYFVVLGLFDVYRMLNSEFQTRYRLFLIGLYSLYFVLFVSYYFVVFNEKIKTDFSFGLGEAIQYADKINPNDTINITTNSINMPYIYVCFYAKIEPSNFRKTIVYKKYEDNMNNNGFREVKSFGRYTFGINKSAQNAISILSEEEVLLKNIDISCAKKFGNYYVLNCPPHI
ncbi:MAG: glycosyltransferase family 39 protein [Paludibacter sp.]